MEQAGDRECLQAQFHIRALLVYVLDEAEQRGAVFDDDSVCAGTHLEYYDAFSGDTGEGSFKAYIHSAAEGAVAREKGCDWRQPNTSVVLAPKGAEGDRVTYGFKFQWADDYDAVRRIVVDEGLIDIQVVPGMTVPCDLIAKFSLRTRQRITLGRIRIPGRDIDRASWKGR